MPKENGKDNKIMLVIVFSLVFLIAGGMAGYFIGSTHRIFPRGTGFSISDSTKSEITAFFDSSPTTEQAKSYCQQNMTYCFYYCRQANPSSSYCSQLNLFPQRGMPQQSG